jgi:hypothetical protein
MLVHACNLSYLEAGGERILWSEAGPRQKLGTLSKNETKAKRARTEDQVVECLPSKGKALGSNSNASKKKKKSKKKQMMAGGMAQEVTHLPSKEKALKYPKHCHLCI